MFTQGRGAVQSSSESESPAPSHLFPEACRLPPWFSTVASKKPSDPKINLWRNSCPGPPEESLRQAAGHAARAQSEGSASGTLQSTGATSARCPLPHPSFSRLKVESSVCQSQDVSIPWPNPLTWLKFPDLRHTACQSRCLPKRVRAANSRKVRDSAPVMSLPSQSGHCHPHINPGSEGTARRDAFPKS